VLSVLGTRFSASLERVWRARFSAVTESEVRGALGRLGKPNAAEALAVDVRQQLDLKVGVAFTRLLTRALRDAARLRFGLPALKLISYGPCQTPTLFFTVERQSAIDAFVPRQFWTLHASATLPPCTNAAAAAATATAPVHTITSGAAASSAAASASAPVLEPSRLLDGGRVHLAWSKGTTFNRAEAARAHAACHGCAALSVSALRHEARVTSPPAGLNTVGLLKLCSGALGCGPVQAMAIAEELYTSGFLSVRCPTPRPAAPRLHQLTTPSCRSAHPHCAY
jgi:DNA topoisomerase-3